MGKHYASRAGLISAEERRFSSSTILFDANGSSGDNEDEQQSSPPPRRRNVFVRVLTRVLGWRLSFGAKKFASLSARAKLLLIVNVVFSLGCGAMIANRVSPIRRHRPPIEIAYSSFLDLIDEQKTVARQPYSSSKDSSAAEVPVQVDKVRIGEDKIVFRLYRERETEGESLPSNRKKTTKAAAAAVVASEQPRSKRQQRKLERQRRAQEAAAYVTAYTLHVPDAAPQSLLQKLREKDISFAAAIPPKNTAASIAEAAVRSFLLSFYCLILWRLYRTVTGMGGGAGGRGGDAKDAPGKLAQASDLPAASFDDIQGMDQAKSEVMELVDTLRNPEKYQLWGARAPTGLLLEGPPGTGKTLLARATAAKAGLPLLYCSGSDFVEVYVGRGAARIRTLFERAQKMSPCILFIDELDALGKARDGTLNGGNSGFNGLGGGRNDEAEQTMNQLLACMDGLDNTRRICVMAATNRRQVLDPALIRPGRLDRIVKVELPDAKGREDILRVHCKKLPHFTEGRGVDPNRQGAVGVNEKIDLSAVAAITQGLSGAELEFIVNEAAIRAVRRVSATIRARQQEASDDDDTAPPNNLQITPNVLAIDFEASLANFFETRRASSGGVNELLKSVWK